jgi:hypothetical protein
MSIMSAISSFFAPPPPTKEVIEATAAQQAALTNLLAVIDAGGLKDFSIGDAPIALTKNEKAIVVLPGINLWEPRSIRVKTGSGSGSSIRVMKGLSFRFGTYGSTGESHDEMRKIDTGTLVVTNRRLVFEGQQRTVSHDTIKIIGVDYYLDGVGIHCEKRDKVQVFEIPSSLITITNNASKEELSLPITGQILHRIITFIINHPDIAA